MEEIINYVFSAIASGIIGNSSFSFLHKRITPQLIDEDKEKTKELIREELTKNIALRHEIATRLAKIQVTRLPSTTQSELFGRDYELIMLDNEWANSKKTNILVLKAMGGTGKTALLQKFLDNFNSTTAFRGAEAIYIWSFYSQDEQVSADEFFNKALVFFGYQGETIISAHDKGIKLAELVNQQQTLLILDGLESLQYPVGTMRGSLKDKGLQALLLQLATDNQGLCLISSRQSVPEIESKPLVFIYDLGQLRRADGVNLLKSFGLHTVETSLLKHRETIDYEDFEEELKKAVNEVGGHALALNLLGSYVKIVFKGDIRRRDTIPALSNEHEEGSHAEKIMMAYETHLKGTTALSILYMMGLFDRPVSAAAIQYLRNAKIPLLTDQLNDEVDWFYALNDLRQQQLLNSSDSNHSETLDTHPLIREYFSKQLKKNAPYAQQQAHCLLYDYYKGLPKKEQPDTLEEMEPLFSAITHGCAAGMYQQALDEVYWPRVRRETEMYIGKKLGAFGIELSALSQFFSQHWDMPVTDLTKEDRASILNFSAFNLRALGRLEEAVKPIQIGLLMWIEQEDWVEASKDANNLSELQLIRGVISLAIEAGQQSVKLADKSADIFSRIRYRTTLADALHQEGDITSSHKLFKEAEILQMQESKENPQLYSVQGLQYCDLLLKMGKLPEVHQRAVQSIEIAQKGGWLLDIALSYLLLGRVSFQQAVSEIIEQENKVLLPLDVLVFSSSLSISLSLQDTKVWLDLAIDGLRKSGYEEFLLRGLLARACYFRLRLCVKDNQALNLCLADLKETRETAQRGGMMLYFCDYHLESARLALSIGEAVFNLTAKEHIQKAKQLIETTGYKRRLPEVEYLEELQISAKPR